MKSVAVQAFVTLLNVAIGMIVAQVITRVIGQRMLQAMQSLLSTIR